MSGGLSEGMKANIVSIVDALVSGNSARLAASGELGRLTPAQVDEVVRGYGRTLRSLPEEAWKHVRVYERSDGSAGVDVDLWTTEEGRSDLTLQLESRIENGGRRLVVHDLRVL